ncbi:hypothetical protein [Lentzea sp. NPDC092896]|uniref:hypothetical protein n=1 Tax=Lentzea sp. NPDC092896 TaxID=3364127 RepID=UPI00380507C1
MRSALALGLAVAALATGLTLATAPSALAYNNLPCGPGNPTQSDQAVATSLNGRLNGRLRAGVNSYQVSCARAVVETVRSRGLDEHAAAIAITTTIVESNIKNLDGGDRDSRGLFQQRPSQGWGTPEQVVDPVHATNEFVNHLLRVTNWHGRPIGEVCQDVQRSGTPDAYGPQAHDGEVIAGALWGGGARNSRAARYSSDFNGNGSSDYAAYQASDGSFHVLFDTGGAAYHPTWRLGQAGDLPITGDWNGNGNSDYGVYRPSDGSFHILFDSGGLYEPTWRLGGPGSLPVAGDWNGNGNSDYAVYNPADGSFHVLFDSGGLYEPTWRLGQTGDLPVAGDWNGNGNSDYGVYRPSDGSFHVLFDTGGLYEPSWRLGQTGDRPVAGDWNGNGNSDYGVYRPSDGSFHVLFDTGGLYEPSWRLGSTGHLPV